MMANETKAEMGIEEKAGIRWVQPQPIGWCPELRVLSSSYISAFDFSQAMVLPAYCSARTHVLNLLNRYECWGSWNAHVHAKGQSIILATMNREEAFATIHSTQVPSDLNRGVFLEEHAEFRKASPQHLYTAIILGCGFGLEETKIRETTRITGPVDIINMDIIQWTEKVRVVSPREPILRHDEKRAHFIGASISISRNPIDEIPSAVTRIVEALSADGVCCIADDDAADFYFSKLVPFLHAIEGLGLIHDVSF